MRKTMLAAILAFASIAGVSAMENAELSIENSNFEKTVGPSSFCMAIMKGELETVKKMIELGEDVNQKSLGMTPAHYAARYNKAEILELLIKNGANLKKRCDKGYTVKKYAELSNATAALNIINTAMDKG